MTHAQLLADAAHQVAASYRSPLVRVTRTIWIRADKREQWQRHRSMLDPSKG